MTQIPRTGAAAWLPPVIAGALFMAVNSTVGALDAVIVRFVAADVHPFGIVFFRNLFSLLFLAFFLPRIGPNPFRSSMWPVHFLRAVLKLAALIAYFYAVTLLPLSVAITVAFTTPLFVSLGSMLFLGERPRLLRLLALAACLGLPFCIPFTDIGEQHLKNISRPVRAYRVSGTSPVARLASAYSGRAADPA